MPLTLLYRASPLLYHMYVTPDRKACENIQGKPVDLAYNVASFIWRPKLGSKVNIHTMA